MRIFYLMGKSAAGKDTIYRKLSERFPMLRPLIPYTTRPQRAGEAEGREYHFVSEARFLELRDSGRMIEERAYQTEKGLWRYGSVDEGGGEDTLWLGIGTLERYRKFCSYFGREGVILLGGRCLRAVKEELCAGTKGSRALLCRVGAPFSGGRGRLCRR